MHKLSFGIPAATNAMSSRGNPIRVGRLDRDRGDLGMTADQRGRHLYVVGSTGVGKSKLLEHLIRQDIKARLDGTCGLLLLDPHGTIYRNTIEWLAEHSSVTAKLPIVPIDLTQDEWVVAYNLLKRRTTATAEVVVGAMMSAVLHVFGATSVWQTPLLARWLQNTLRILYDRQVTLVELVPLLDDPAFRASLADATKDLMARSDWLKAAKLKPEKFEEQIGSTLNRLQAFVRNELLSASFGQTDVSLDMRVAMDEGKIILVNCSQSRGKMTEFDCQLFATMMLSDLWTAAKEREKERNAQPFYVYVDEFQNFVSETIAKNLDQARGYGLHLTLAHQFPKQLRNEGPAGEKIYDSVLANASNKIVFRMEHPDDLESLTKWLYMQTINPDKTQLELHSTKVLGHREETRTIETYGSTTGHSSGTAASAGSGTSAGQTVSKQVSEDGTFTSKMQAEGEQTSENSRTGSSESLSESTSESTSSADVPMLIPIYGKELSSVTFESLDVQWFRRMQEVSGQGDRECVARLVGMNAPLRLRTLDVKPGKATKAEVRSFLKKRYKKLKFALPFDEAKRLMVERQAKLKSDVSATHDEPITARRIVRKAT